MRATVRGEGSQVNLLPTSTTEPLVHLAILGATGRTGVPLVERAVAADHAVRALVRTPRKRRHLPQDVEVVRGDARDVDVLAAVVAGTDAVIDVSGPTDDGPDDLRRTIVPRLVEAMQEAEVPRLVLLTGAGVRVDGDTPKLVDHAIRWIMERTVPDVLEDAVAAVEVARASDREVVVVRGPRLVDGARGEYHAVPHVGQGHSSRLGRGDLAAFLLECATSPDHVGEAPVVSW